MKSTLMMVMAVVAMMSLAASAGTISGKVSGVAGESVVYVEAPAGKTFPAPTQQPVMDQKGLMFAPHIVVVQQGTTVQFLNSDSVAHNVFWISIGGNKKLGHNLGTWPKGEKKSLTIRAQCRCCAMCTRRCQAMSWCRPPRTLLRLTSRAPTRSRTFPTAATP